MPRRSGSRGGFAAVSGTVFGGGSAALVRTAAASIYILLAPVTLLTRDSSSGR